MVRYSLTKRLESLERTSPAPAIPSERKREMKRLAAFLRADAAYQAAIAVTGRFSTTSACLADSEGRKAAKNIAAVLTRFDWKNGQPEDHAAERREAYLFERELKDGKGHV